MGTGEPSLSFSRLPSISSFVWLWVEVSDLLDHVFPIDLKLQSKNPLSQETFSQFWTLGVEIWVQGNLPSLPHDLPQFLLLCDCGSKFQTCYVFMLFSALSLLAFWFSLVKAPLTFCSLYIWNFGLDSPQINTSKEPKGRFGPFSHFWPLSQKRPQQILKTLAPIYIYSNSFLELLDSCCAIFVHYFLN